MKPKKIIRYSRFTPEEKRKFDKQFESGFENATTEFKDLRTGEKYTAVSYQTDEFDFLVRIDSAAVFSRFFGDDDDDNNDLDDIFPISGNEEDFETESPFDDAEEDSYSEAI